MEDKEMLKRLNIISSKKIEEAVMEYPHKIPYFSITVEDKDALKQLLEKYKNLTKRINKVIEQLERQIYDCELEAKSSLNNSKCLIAIDFDKSILATLKRRIIYEYF